MAKQHLLIVDSDPKSLRVLEVSLKKAGFSVTRASNGLDAIEKINISAPDMVITETAMPEMNGFELIQQLRANPEWQDIPVMFLTAQKSIEDKIRGLEQGVEDYLTKPIFIREILARVSLVMQRRQRERLETRGSKTEFSGSLGDMGIIDLIQTIDISQKSGVIHVEREGDSGDIYFRNGKVIDASTSSRHGEDAVYRMLVWSDGHFQIEFKHVANEDTISLSTQGLLMEGMRRLDEWGRLQEQLPSLNSVFDIDDQLLAERLGEIPDEINSLLKHFDGRRSLLEVVNLCPLGDLEALTIITKLFFEGLILEIETAPDELETAPPIHPLSGVEAASDVSIPAPGVVDTGVGDYETHGENLVRPSDVVPAVRASNPPGGGYRTSRQPETVVSTDSTQQMPGVNVSLPPEQQTMMMHVSRTPTNPPPGVGSQASKETSPLPLPASDDGSPLKNEDAAERKSSAPQEDPLSGGETISGMASPAEFDELVQGEADIDTTTPSAVVSIADDVAENAETDTLAEAASHKTDANAEESGPAADGGMSAGDDSLADDAAVIASPSVDNADAPHDESDTVGESQTLPADESEDAPAEDTESEDTDSEDTDSEVDGEVVGDAEAIAEEDGSAESDESDDGGEADIEDGEEDDDVDEDDDIEDDWAELDSAASRGSLKIILLSVAAVILIGGAAGIVFGTDWVLKKSGPGNAVADNTKPVKKVADKSPETTKDLKLLDTDTMTTVVDSDQANAAMAVAENAEDGTLSTDSATESATGDTDSAPVKRSKELDALLSPAPLEPMAKPDEAQMAEYKKLLKKSEKQARGKQLESLENAIAIYPHGVTALTEYAINGMERRKYQDKALEYAIRVTRLDPGNAKAWLAIGYIYQLKGQTDESKAAYKKCAECKGPPDFVRNCKLLAR